MCQERSDYGACSKLKAYSELVEVYTARKFTNKGGISNAFFSRPSVSTGYFNRENVNGLPIAALDLALLWTSAGRLGIRQHLQRLRNNPHKHQSQNFRFWSWAGWTSNIVRCLLFHLLGISTVTQA